jgi:hypothetical protein
MIQSIAENNKKNDSVNKKSAESDPNKTKNVVKKSSKNHDKMDISEKTVGNLDKTISGTTIKNQQNTTVSSQKNVPPFLLAFEIFNRNIHNCIVDSGASSNVMPLSMCQKINAEVKPSDLKIIQLDQTNINVIHQI